MIDTIAVEVVQKTIIGRKTIPTGTLTEIHGMDAVSQRVCVTCDVMVFVFFPPRIAFRIQERI